MTLALSGCAPSVRHEVLELVIGVLRSIVFWPGYFQKIESATEHFNAQFY